MTDEQKILYHYTSVDALFNIVQSKTFWLANSKSSNDKKENSLSLKQYKKMLEDIISTCQYDEIKDAIRIFLNRSDLSSFLSDNKKFFILSLTNQKDNLTHWERYASFRRGVSVALNADILKIIRTKNYSMFQDDILRDCKLLYTRKVCISKIEEEIVQYYNILNKTPKDYIISLISSRLISLFLMSYYILKISFLKMKQNVVF